MTEIAAYYNATAPEYRKWIAYVVLSDGKLWGVYATGATEDEAVRKIVALWDNEQAKFKTQSNSWDMIISPGANTTANREHHRVGKIWMRHKETRELVSIPLTEITMYEGKGYERSGPRSK